MTRTPSESIDQLHSQYLPLSTISEAIDTLGKAVSTRKEVTKIREREPRALLIEEGRPLHKADPQEQMCCHIPFDSPIVISSISTSRLGTLRHQQLLLDHVELDALGLPSVVGERSRDTIWDREAYSCRLEPTQKLLTATHILQAGLPQSSTTRERYSSQHSCIRTPRLPSKGAGDALPHPDNTLTSSRRRT